MATELPVVIDRTSPVPLYHQLSEQLTAAIESGALKPGDPFENELALAERLELSRPTVRRAIAEMVSRGLLVRRRGIGTTVANEVIHRRNELTSLFDDLKSAGRVPRTELLTLEPGHHNETVARALALPAEAPLVRIERLRLADDEPLAVLRNWLPPEYSDVTENDLATGGMYAWLRTKGARPAVAHQTIGARRPHVEESRLLNVSRSAPLLTMTRMAYDAAGKPLEYGDHCYRADLYAFDFTVHDR